MDLDVLVAFSTLPNLWAAIFHITPTSVDQLEQHEHEHEQEECKWQHHAQSFSVVPLHFLYFGRVARGSWYAYGPEFAVAIAGLGLVCSAIGTAVAVRLGVGIVANGSKSSRESLSVLGNG